ncbi:MAG: transposase [Planctomycetota bacterium]
MGYPLRVSFAGAMYHVTTRGNNRQKVFLDDDDFDHFRQLLRRYRTRHAFNLHAYCLMPNHVHLLLETTTAASISQIMHDLNLAYAKFFNAKYDRTGHVWQGRFHSKIIDSERYFLDAMRYMDLNPVRAEIAKRPDEYEWASYRRYARGDTDDLVTPHDLYKNLGKQDRKRERVYREFVEQGMGQPSPVYAYSIFAGGDDFTGRMERAYGEQIWPKYRRLLERLSEIRRTTLPE